VFLFFERGSGALGEVRDYFDALQAHGVTVVTQDAAIDPALAKKMKVSKNGTVGLRCGERSETWQVGEDREEASKKLGKLDEEIRTRLAKISKDPSTVYFTASACRPRPSRSSSRALTRASRSSGSPTG
jgi:hypothetical protein